MTRPASFFVSIVASVCLLLLVYPHSTHAALTDGMNASDVVGQVDFDSSTSATTQDGMEFPYSVAIDRTHHRLFVADRINNRVLQYDLNTDNTFIDHSADHVLGQSDFTSSTLATTQNGMRSPRGVTYDSTNNRLFVADYSNNRVLTFNVSSITDGEDAVSVLGQPDFTSSSGVTTQNGMNSPAGLTYDSTNNRLFVAERSNNRILTFNVSSITDGEDAINVLGQPDFTTSDSATTQNGLNDPFGITYDSTNNRLFVAEGNNNRVLTFNVSSITDGEDAINVLGQPDFTTSDAATTQNGMSYPQGVTYDSTNNRLFVLEYDNSRVLVFDASSLTNGQYADNVLGQSPWTKSDSATTQSGLFNPDVSTLDTVHHRLFVADGNNHRVLEYDLNTDNTLTDHTADHVLGQPDFTSSVSATTQNGMDYPYGLAYDSTNNRLFVVENGNSRILTFNVSSITDGEDAINVLGQPDFTSNGPATTQNGMFYPQGIAYDPTNSRLFVADSNNSRILTFNVSSITDGEDAINVLGQPDFTTSDYATTQNGMDNPYALSYDSTNNRLFVADSNNHRVLTFNVSSITDGEDAINVLGQLDFTSSVSATTQNGMQYTYGVAYDSTNNRLFVVDGNNHRVLTFNVSSITDGEDAINVLGQPDFTSDTPATTQNGMQYPEGITYDSTNNHIIVGDGNNDRILFFNTTSITDGEDADDLLGQNAFESNDTATTQNGMSNPYGGVAYDPDNDLLYVADTSNNRVTLFSFGNPPTPTPEPNTDTPSESDSEPGVDPASDSFGTGATTFRTHIPQVFKPGKQTRITITPPDMDQLQKAKITIFGKTYTFKPHGGKQKTIIIPVPKNPKSTSYVITLTYANKQLKQHGTLRMWKAK